MKTSYPYLKSVKTSSASKSSPSVCWRFSYWVWVDKLMWSGRRSTFSLIAPDESNHHVKQVGAGRFGWDTNRRWNKRLDDWGRFFRDGHLDFNPKIYETFGLETENCPPWATLSSLLSGKGYRHGDRDFKDLLKQLTVWQCRPSCPTANLFYLWMLEHFYLSQTQVDIKISLRLSCRGKLSFLKEEINGSYEQKMNRCRISRWFFCPATHGKMKERMRVEVIIMKN